MPEARSRKPEVLPRAACPEPFVFAKDKLCRRESRGRKPEEILRAKILRGAVFSPCDALIALVE